MQAFLKFFCTSVYHVSDGFCDSKCFWRSSTEGQHRRLHGIMNNNSVYWLIIIPTPSNLTQRTFNPDLHYCLLLSTYCHSGVWWWHDTWKSYSTKWHKWPPLICPQSPEAWGKKKKTLNIFNWLKSWTILFYNLVSQKTKKYNIFGINLCNWCLICWLIQLCDIHSNQRILHLFKYSNYLLFPSFIGLS